MYNKSISWILVVLLQVILIENSFANDGTIKDMLKTYEDSVRLMKANMKVNFTRAVSDDPDNYLYEKYQNPQLKAKVRELIRKVEHIDLNKIEADDLYRQLYRIKHLEQGVNDSVLVTYVDCLKKFSNALYKPRLCAKNHTGVKTDCTMAYVPDIKNILHKSTSVEEMKYYWMEFRDKNQEAANLFFSGAAQFRLAIAKGNEKGHYYFQEQQDLRQEIDRAMDALQPFYEKVHSALRAAIGSEFPEEVSDSFIPHYLLEFGKQKLKEGNTEMLEFNSFLSKLEFSPATAIATTKKFFKYILVPDVKQFLASRKIQVGRRNFGDQCIPEMVELNYKMCPTVNFATFKKIYSDIIQYQYEQYLVSRKIGFDQEPIPGFKGALAESAFLDVSSIEYLSKFKKFEHFNFTPAFEHAQISDMVVDLMIDLQLNYVNELFMMRVLIDKIKPSEYNREYWKIMEDIAGFSAPINTRQNSIDFNYQMYDHFNAFSSLSKIVSKLAGYQIYEGLCKNISANALLARCDYSENAPAGKLFSNALYLGTQKSYSHILEALTGKKTIDASAILRFYKPFLEELQN